MFKFSLISLSSMTAVRKKRLKLNSNLFFQYFSRKAPALSCLSYPYSQMLLRMKMCWFEEKEDTQSTSHLFPIADQGNTNISLGLNVFSWHFKTCVCKQKIQLLKYSFLKIIFVWLNIFCWNYTICCYWLTLLWLNHSTS